MIKKIILFILIALVINLLTATEKKSAKQAMLMSAILPGAGQLYLGQNTKASILMTTDIISLISYFRFAQEKNLMIDNYKLYANVNAGLKNNADDYLYNLAQKYKSAEIYNNNLELRARNYFILLNNDQESYDAYMQRNSISSEDMWEWQTDSDFKKYRSIRNDKQRYEIYQNFALGSIILNRIIGVVDAAISTNKVNKKTQLYSVPDFERKGISLIYEVKF